MSEKKESSYIYYDVKPWAVPEKPTNILVIGKPKHGKTFLTRQLLNEMWQRKLIKFGVIISATASRTGDFDFIPKDYIITVKDADDAISKLTAHVKTLEDRADKVGKQNVPPNFIVLDDMVGSINQYSSELKRLYSTFRHTQTYCITCSQVIGQGSSTVLRQCAEWIFLFTGAELAGKRETQALYEEFGGMRTFKEFAQILDMGTSEEHCALLIDTTTKDKLKRFQTYKAANKKIKPMDWVKKEEPKENKE